MLSEGAEPIELATRPVAGRAGNSRSQSAAASRRVIARRTAVNTARRSRLRTAVRKAEEAIKAGDKSAALAAVKAAEPEIMKAAQNGVIHRNTANRKVSRLAHAAAKLGK